MIDTRILAKNLKLLRTMRGISQDELSAAIYTARTTYASYENGTKVPSLPCIDAIASFYSIQLMQEEELMETREITEEEIAGSYPV